MTCNTMNQHRAVVCGFNTVTCLTTSDGWHFWLEWHDYLGPTVWLDRHMTRDHPDWYEDGQVAEAVEQWIKRTEAEGADGGNDSGCQKVHN